VYEKHQLSNLERQYKANQEVVYRMEEKVIELRERQNRLGDDEQVMIQYAHDVEVQISNTTKDLQVKRLELEALRRAVFFRSDVISITICLHCRWLARQ
jgi:hypothetical protein